MACTCPSPSGRFFVIATASFPEDLPTVLSEDFLDANSGDLIELFSCSDDWGFGSQLQQINGAFPTPGVRLRQGAFHLDWVRGIISSLRDEKLHRSELDVRSHEYSFCRTPATDVGSRFHAKCQQRCMERASRLWAQSLPIPPGLGIAGGMVSVETQTVFDDPAVTTKSPDKYRSGDSGGSPDKETAQSPPLSAAGSTASRRAQRQRERRFKSGVSARFTQGLLNAKRSGELHMLVDEWTRDQNDMVTTADSLGNVRDRFKAIMIGAHRTGELHKVAGDLAAEVQSKANQFQRLKERTLQSLLRMKRAGELERLANEMPEKEQELVPAKERALRSLLEMKRSGDLERIAQEMSDAQDQLEEKAAQLKDIAGRMRKGLLDARRSGELERIAREAAQMLEVKGSSIGERLRNAMLRAHRTGELELLRWELDELDDEVPALFDILQTPSSGVGQESKSAKRRGRTTPLSSEQRWAELATSSESDFDPRRVQATRGVHSGVAAKKRQANLVLGRVGNRARSHSADSMSDSDRDPGTPFRSSPQGSGTLMDSAALNAHRGRSRSADSGNVSDSQSDGAQTSQRIVKPRGL